MNSFTYTPANSLGILWFAREGRSTYRFLRSHGIAPSQITLYDEATTLQDLPSGSHAYLWPLDADKLLSHDHIFVAPGLTLYMLEQKLGKTALHLLLPKLTSQTQYFFDHYQGIVIGITGTKGKSTISTLTYLMLQAAGKSVQLVGNVGKPVLDEIDRTTPPDIVVYELSSFMLEKLQHAKCTLGVLNTLYPAHTKEHWTHEAYVAAKVKLLDMSDTALVGAQVVEQLNISLPKQSYLYGKTGKRTFQNWIFYEEQHSLFTDQQVLLLGEHNRENICAVIGVCMLLDIDLTHLQSVLSTFSGLEHRIEYVGRYNDIIWYNDAIATTPQATIAAIETFQDKLDTIFLGGSEGNYDFSGVVQLLTKYKVKNIVLFPDTGTRIKTLLDPSQHTIFETKSMQEAVQRASQVTQKNKVALLSCGSPSFSLRSSYTEKGQLFKQYVRHLYGVK